MRQSTFVERRQAGWQRLEGLLHKAQRGIRRLDPDEVAELGTGYRWVTSDLAYANARGYDATLRAYLNRLTAGAHAFVYGARSEGGFQRTVRFYSKAFPSEVRRSAMPILLSVALFLGAFVAAYSLIRAQPLDALVLLPAQLTDPIHRGLREQNFIPMHAAFGSPTLSAFIMQNNIRLAILAFAGGMTLGVVTVVVLVTNGLTLGGMAALYQSAGFGHDFWATIAPHGVIELSAVQIAAGAGLLLAAGIVAPGRLRRRDALALNARRAGVLIIGVASMLVVAGLVEGFFSPANYPAPARLAFGAFTAVALTLYFSWGARSRN